MLIKVSATLVALLVLLFVLLQSDMLGGNDSVETVMPTYQSNEKQLVTKENSSNQERINKKNEDLPAVKSNREMELQETEEVLIDMVKEYQDVKSDPQLRESQRERMAEELSTYSDQVLPIALEKMKARQLNNAE